MTTNSNDIVQIAKRARKALKEAFPATKFSVRTERFAGGSALNVGWVDGPVVEQVEKVTQTAANDPYHAQHHHYEDYWSGSHYYSYHRRYSVDVLSAAAENFATNYADFIGIEYDVRPSTFRHGAELHCECYRFIDTVLRSLREEGIAA